MPLARWVNARTLIFAVALLAGSTPGCFGCSGSIGSEEAEALRSRFPEQAAQVVDGAEAFEAVDDGFRRSPSAETAAPSLDLVLPRNGEGSARFRTAEGFEVRVREVGVVGEGRLAESAVAYQRARGTSFWTVVPGGFEEWLHLEAGATRGDGPAASWEVEGASLRQEGELVLIVDEAGLPRVRVTAPAAYALGGRQVQAHLAVAGAMIELRVDAGDEEVLVDPAWTAAASMSAPRGGHAVARLDNGKVLVVGGITVPNTPTTSVELYDPATNAWTNAASMLAPAQQPEATLLANGKVLISCEASPSAQLFDPVGDSWSAAAAMITPRRLHTATRLSNGKVLVAGGYPGYATTEIYDPGANTWTAGPTMVAPRHSHTATALQDGTVLLVGGRDTQANTVTAGVESYDPIANALTAKQALGTGRSSHAATLLGDGRVFITGGSTPSVVLATTELYTPSTNSWVGGPALAASTQFHTSTLLSSGKVLVAGGDSGGAQTAIFDPAANTMAIGPSMAASRYYHSATLLGSGAVLVAGGRDLGGSGDWISSAELYYEGTALGSPCAIGATCLSLFCSDGVCCNTACAGSCDVCSVAAGASSNGTCKPLTGTACSDGNPCTQTDTCQAGACIGTNPVVCTPIDACHDPGICDLALGTCTVPLKAEGSGCTDGNVCTQTDVCLNGVCVGLSPKVCGSPYQCAFAGTCDPASGICDFAPKPNGTPCSDGNACTLGDVCSDGNCDADAFVVCPPSGPCQDTASCNTATGVCSAPSKANGSNCTDGSACTQGDLCQNGACVGLTSTVCAPAGPCQLGGGCDPGSGACLYSSKPNGTSCDDGNGCTQTDTCNNGSCDGDNPVTCAPQDQCHNAGTCAAATGLCSNPTKSDGTACNDGNVCTQNDVCQAGACLGSTFVTCGGPSDQCHAAGVCNPVTGACSNPPLANGTSCNDGNPCTQNDACQAGTCTGQTVACAPSDACHTAGVCNPATGQCSNPFAALGTACNDGNVCTQTDTCQAGNCIGANPIVCAAQDSCHNAGTCAPATGACSNPVKADGASCNDASVCTQNDVCQDGVCVGSTAVSCPPSDQCHTTGVCNPVSGACSNPLAANGAACNDGNPCTQSDACQAGTCAGQAVVCAPSDACHTAGVCNPATGQCSNPFGPPGTPCNDGNVCTQTDTCQAGTCVGQNPIVCVAQDPCHDVGICAPASGLCSNPAKVDGGACNDGNACTQNDVCQGGTCLGSTAVTCAPSDQCHAAGVCNPATGACSNPLLANGVACNDGNPCTQSDACQAGTCGGQTIACAPSDACHTAGVCNPATGQCSNPFAPIGTPCNDGSVCTPTDTCQAGNCIGQNPVVCSAQDPCHVAGTCNPATGACSNPEKPDGAPCNDANVCTQSDTCQGGVCFGSSPVICGASDQCHTQGVCNPATGACSNPLKSNGAPCNDANVCTQSDSCQAGTCTGQNPVSCAPLDACHAAGVCNAVTGQCSNPWAPNGTACNDGNACTQTDFCDAGVCVGSNAVLCVPMDACHVAGTCNPVSGSCSNVDAINGTPCDDGDLCIVGESCQGGTCTGAPLTCPALDECHSPGQCNPGTGSCSAPIKADGAACTGGACVAGICKLAPDGGATTAASSGGSGTGGDGGGGGSGAGTSASSGASTSATGAGGSGTSTSTSTSTSGAGGGGTSASGSGGSSTSASGTGGSGTGASGTSATGTSGTGGSGTGGNGTGGSGAGGSGTSSGGTGGGGTGGSSSSGTAANGTGSSGTGATDTTTAGSSGNDGNAEVSSGCGCGVSGSRVGGGVWLALALTLATRRRVALRRQRA